MDFSTKKLASHCRLLCLGALLLLLEPARGFATQSEAFALGQMIENVSCKADPQQSFALYLPTNYTPNRKWPTLYAFDPAARGKLPVSLFKDAAEKLGFIVIGSNNSKNGIAVANVVNTLWNDTHARLAIDDRRVYTTGFSGGSRVAFATALAYQPAIAGVIACSAGFPGNAPPLANIAFAVFSTTGTEDFNFPEMQQLKRNLDGARVPNHLEVFSGDHDWPPADVCAQALAWMELQAMKKGTRPRDQLLIDQMLSDGVNKARAYETAGKNYEAYLAYAALAADFNGLGKVSEFEANAVRLRDLKDVKSAIKNERAEEDGQRSLETKLQGLLSQIQTLPANPDAVVELRSVISDLTRKSEDEKDISQQRVARRVLRAVFVQAYETANGFNLRKDFAGAAENLEIAALLQPKNPYVFYELAVAHARAGRKSKSIDALGRAVKNGFKDVSRIEQNDAFDALRNEAGYKKLVAGMKDGS